MHANRACRWLTWSLRRSRQEPVRVNNPTPRFHRPPSRRGHREARGWTLFGVSREESLYQGCDLLLIAPLTCILQNYWCVQKRNAPYGVGNVGGDLQLIAPNHEPEFEFGAFKNGTHPTGSAMLSVRSKTERTLRGR